MILAHAGGWDEIALFLAVPAAYFSYFWTRRWWARRHGRVWPQPPEETPDRAHRGGDPGEPD